MSMTRWAIFVSGTGSNLQHLLSLEPTWRRHRIELVVANRACAAIEKAKAAKKPTVIKKTSDPDHDTFIAQLMSEYQIDRILLLGYLRLFSAELIRSLPRPILNLHPSKLPDYPGLNAIQRAFADGQKQLGVSLIEIDEGVDTGRVVRQRVFEIDQLNTLEEVVEFVHSKERHLLGDFFLDLERSEQLP